MSEPEWKNADGIPTTLYRLVRSEPDWAQSRILAGLRDAAELATLRARVAELEGALDESMGREAGAMAKADQLARLVGRWAQWLRRCPTCGGYGQVPDRSGPEPEPVPCPTCEELREETCVLADRYKLLDGGGP